MTLYPHFCDEHRQLGIRVVLFICDADFNKILPTPYYSWLITDPTFVALVAPTLPELIQREHSRYTISGVPRNIPFRAEPFLSLRTDDAIIFDEGGLLYSGYCLSADDVVAYSASRMVSNVFHALNPVSRELVLSVEINSILRDFFHACENPEIVEVLTNDHLATNN